MSEVTVKQGHIGSIALDQSENGEDTGGSKDEWPQTQEMEDKFGYEDCEIEEVVSLKHVFEFVEINGSFYGSLIFFLAFYFVFLT